MVLRWVLVQQTFDEDKEWNTPNIVTRATVLGKVTSCGLSASSLGDCDSDAMYNFVSARRLEVRALHRKSTLTAVN